MGNLYHTTGNVGIRTTNPLVRLDVHGGSLRVDSSGAFEQSVAFSSAAGGWARGLFFVDGTAAGTFTGITGGIGMDGGNSSPSSLFVGWGDSPWETGTTAKGLRILTNGNVGVGTSSPTTKLDVNGSVKVRGVLTVNETSSFTTGAIKCRSIEFTGSSHIGVGVGTTASSETLKYSTPWYDYSNSATQYKPHVLRYGKIVVITGLVQNTTATSANSVVISGLPTPRYQQEFFGLGPSSNTTSKGFTIRKNGQLTMNTASTAGLWHSINCAYIAE